MSYHVNKTPEKATFAVTHIITKIIKPVAYTETTCVPDLSIYCFATVAKNNTSAWTYDILRNDYKMLQSLLRYCLT